MAVQRPTPVSAVLPWPGLGLGLLCSTGSWWYAMFSTHTMAPCSSNVCFVIEWMLQPCPSRFYSALGLEGPVHSLESTFLCLPAAALSLACVVLVGMRLTFLSVLQ